MKVGKSRIVNLSTDTYEVYAGRGRQVNSNLLTPGLKPGQEGWLGNPHPIGFCTICNKKHSREECIQAFRDDFHQKLESDTVFRESVSTLRGKVLGCYCKPKACHGDIIVAWLDQGE